MSKFHIEDDSDVSRISSELFKGFQEVSQEAIGVIAKSGKGKSAAIHAVLNGTAGIINVLATLVANHVKPDNIEDLNPNLAVTPEVLLFTALLVNKCAPVCEPDGHVQSQFGPHVIWAALEAYERLTGQKPDQFLAPGLAEAGREFAPNDMARVKAAYEANGADRPRYLN